MMSRPARSWSRMASKVASFCACSRYSGATRQSSLARTRGGKRPASFARSISHSGCGYDPTSVVGSSLFMTVPLRTLACRVDERGSRLVRPPDPLVAAMGAVLPRDHALVGDGLVLPAVLRRRIGDLAVGRVERHRAHPLEYLGP